MNQEQWHCKKKGCEANAWTNIDSRWECHYCRTIADFNPVVKDSLTPAPASPPCQFPACEDGSHLCAKHAAPAPSPAPQPRGEAPDFRTGMSFDEWWDTRAFEFGYDSIKAAHQAAREAWMACIALAPEAPSPTPEKASEA